MQEEIQLTPASIETIMNRPDLKRHPRGYLMMIADSRERDVNIFEVLPIKKIKQLKIKQIFRKIDCKKLLIQRYKELRDIDHQLAEE